MSQHIQASGHFLNILNGQKLPAIVKHCKELLKDLDFDTLAFIGYSGAVLAPIIAHEMGKELIMVRKNGGNDNSNSTRWIEGNHGAKRVVVIDDLICSGKTMSQMMHALRSIKENSSPELQIVGLILHCDYPSLKLYTPNSRRRPLVADYFDIMIETEFTHMHPVNGAITSRDVSPMYQKEGA